MNPEKRFLLAVGLSFLILVFYPIYLKWISPPKPAVSKNQFPATSITESVLEHQEIPKEVSEIPESKTHFFSHRYFDVEFSERGGSIVSLKLKKWDKAHTSDFVFIDKSAAVGAFLTDLPNQGIDFTERNFTLELLDVIGGQVRFSSEEAGKWKLVKMFQFSEDKPVIRLQIEVQNLGTENHPTAFELQSSLTVQPSMNGNRTPPESFIALSDKLNSVKLDQALKKPHVFEGNILWQALCEKYFGLFIRPENPASLSQTTARRNESQNLFGLLSFPPEEMAPQGVRQFEFLIYAGPKYYKELKEFEYGFERVLSHGFFGIFKLWLLLVLQWSYGVVKNYGWAIILITVGVKLLFTPLTHMSFESMKKMQALQPKLKALQERYKNDQAALSREMMELYKKNKVKPMGGCLPMLLQIPIFIAFYQVLAQTVELRGAPFIFWIKDLSEPDRFWTLPFAIPFLGDAINILPILMLGSMVWQQQLTPQTGTSDQQKMMMFMPIIFGFMFYNLPSGLVLYWFVNNLLSIFHQLFIKGKALPHHED
jgi:YidC/Oxa1 family membrane protein insertase